MAKVQASCRARCKAGNEREAHGSYPNIFLISDLSFYVCIVNKGRGKVGREGPFFNLTVAMESIAEGIGEYLWRCDVLVTLLVHL